MKVRLAVLAAALAVVATSGCSVRTTGSAGSIPARTAGSIDVAAAVQQWWRRAASIPKAEYFDPRLCGLKQPSGIWLLGGGSTGQQHRMCEIPMHHPILAPVINELLPATSDASHPFSVRGRMVVTLDGRPLTPTQVTNDRPYPISAVPGNPFGLPAGDQVATDRGYWVLLNHGLAPGRHQLTVGAPDLPVSVTGSRHWLLDAW